MAFIFSMNCGYGRERKGRGGGSRWRKPAVVGACQWEGREECLACVFLLLLTCQKVISRLSYIKEEGRESKEEGRPLNVKDVVVVSLSQLSSHFSSCFAGIGDGWSERESNQAFCLRGERRVSEGRYYALRKCPPSLLPPLLSSPSSLACCVDA